MMVSETGKKKRGKRQMNLYIADLHFGHQNIIRLNHRPFADADDMDGAMVSLWNNRVSKDDHVYVVGDFAFRNGKAPQEYLKRLKGHKHLIIGNHDRQQTFDRNYFESIDQIKRIKDGDREIVLCHYPMAEWDGMFRDTWHIYGHIHNNLGETYDIMKKKDHALNAGADINNFTPVSFKELLENNRKFQKTH